MQETLDHIAFNRAYLAIFFTCVAIFYVCRIVYRKYTLAEDQVFSGPTLSATWWNHMAFRLFRAAIWLVCLIRWGYPEFEHFLGILSLFAISWLVIFGELLLAIGFLFTIYCHFSLGRYWRSGIAPANSPSTGLKFDGIYKYSRNPMFVGVALAQLGFFLALPTVFSLLCLGIGLSTLYSQTIQEERHLEQMFNFEYLQYKNKVRRWL